LRAQKINTKQVVDIVAIVTTRISVGRRYHVNESGTILGLGEIMALLYPGPQCRLGTLGWTTTGEQPKTHKGRSHVAGEFEGLDRHHLLKSTGKHDHKRRLPPKL